MAAVFGAVLCVGLVASADYGLGWDEPIQHRLGRQAWSYAAQESVGYLRNRDRFYGPVFELLLQGAEKLLRLEDTRVVYRLRHALTFVTFWVAVLAFNAVARRLLRSWPLALLASALLLLSPRIVADAFYNSKDLPFLSFFVIAVLTLFRFLDQPGPARGLAHALACALATDVRIVGVLLVPLTLLAVVATGREGRSGGLPLARALAIAAVMAAGYVGAVVLLWPFLWQEPVRRFVEAFLVMARFPWQETVLFMGERLPAPALPWFYLPVWIGVSTPLSVLLFLPLGVVAALQGARHRGRPAAEAAVVLAWAFGPVAAVIAMRSVLYDGWRQMYFVYPALVLLAAAGVQAAWRVAHSTGAPGWRRAMARAALALLLADAVATAAWMIRWHPFQNVYFNRLAGRRAAVPERFEADYWGLSARRLLEHVLATDDRSEIGLLALEPSVETSALILPRADRQRLRFVTEARDADYVVTHHRYLAGGATAADDAFVLRVDGMRIGSVFRGGRIAPAPDQP